MFRKKYCIIHTARKYSHTRTLPCKKYTDVDRVPNTSPLPLSCYIVNSSIWNLGNKSFSMCAYEKPNKFLELLTVSCHNEKPLSRGYIEPGSTPVKSMEGCL